MKKYIQKNLGYPREKTNKWIHCSLNGAVFRFPAQVAADSRDEHYSSDKEDTIGFINRGGLDNYDLLDWVSNNMNPEDVIEYSEVIQVPPPPVLDYEFWNECEKKCVPEKGDGK